jgi:hypothetical protein
VGNLRERLAVKKQRSHRFHKERFNLKMLNDVEGKGQFCVESQIGLQVWRIWIQKKKKKLHGLSLRWKLIVPGKRLQKILKLQPKRA